MRISTFLLPLVIAIMLSSCASTERITYFQDVRPGEQITQGITPVTVKVQPEDKISIIVNSKDPLLADLFNLPIVSRQLGTKIQVPAPLPRVSRAIRYARTARLTFPCWAVSTWPA